MCADGIGFPALAVPKYREVQHSGALGALVQEWWPAGGGGRGTEGFRMSAAAAIKAAAAQKDMVWCKCGKVAKKPKLTDPLQLYSLGEVRT